MKFLAKFCLQSLDGFPAVVLPDDPSTTSGEEPTTQFKLKINALASII
jgi:hypothetical protein